MKITKEALKRIIAEELNNMEEVGPSEESELDVLVRQFEEFVQGAKSRGEHEYIVDELEPILAKLHQIQGKTGFLSDEEKGYMGQAQRKLSMR